MKYKKMNMQYEYLRAFAIIAVVAIHTFNSAMVVFGNSASKVQKMVYQGIVDVLWWAVPCFLMLSGTLLLNSDKKIDVKKIYGKYILRMLVVLFSFGWGYAWLELFFVSHTIRICDLLIALKNVLLGNTWAHMWYLYCIIGIYILLPAFKLIADHASDHELKYILCALFFIGMILQLLKSFNVNAGLYFHINTIYPFWFLLGAAQNRGMLNGKKMFSKLTFGVTTVLLITLSIIEELTLVSMEVFWGYSSILVAFQAISLFNIVLEIRVRKKVVNKILMQIADKSFGIYIVHMLFINIVYKVLKFNPFSTSVDIILGVMMVILNLCSSFAMVVVIRKIPFIKKYI